MGNAEAFKWFDEYEVASDDIARKTMPFYVCPSAPATLLVPGTGPLCYVANGGSGGYYQNVAIPGSAGGQTITIVVGQGGAGVPAATTATGGTGSLSFVSIASIGYYLGAGAGTGGAGVFGDNNPPFGGSGGAPNGVAGSNNAFWMTNRNTAGTGYNGQGQNGTGYGDGGLGGNPSGPVQAGSAGGDGFVQFQGYW
jgi:hypothetical protein